MNSLVTYEAHIWPGDSRDKPWTWQDKAFTIKSEVLDMIRRDALPILKHPYIMARYKFSHAMLKGAGPWLIVH